ncbi:uncharacterized protein LOC126852222 [Cataglyphis hispanica]|uniref:uncharacterized protein LOC126852222 n=1 Tax=Cataglyphis hispanica TaxID=1086592 RepID=UPI00217F655A|nr:uncharacterized protein LOC126852222 [Cataglyphis hispanica]
MRHFAIVMLGLIGLVSAKPALLSVPLTYMTTLTPIGTNRGQNLDRLKDPVAHPDERRTNSANEPERSVGSREQESSSPRFVNNAPLDVDGRVVDTPEVAAAKAAHAAAHVKEKINLAKEAARSGSATDSSETSDDVTLTETVLSTPKVARVNENIDLEAGDVLARLRDGSVVPLVLANGVVALVPVGLDGRPLDNVSETMVAHDDQNPVNDARSVDALAIAGPALAYGRLVY